MPETFYVHVVGTEGQLYAEALRGLVQIRADGSRQIGYDATSPERAEIAAFASAIAEGRTYNCPAPDEAVRNLRIIERMLEAADGPRRA